MDCLIEKVQGLLDDDEPGEGTSGEQQCKV